MTQPPPITEGFSLDSLKSLAEIEPLAEEWRGLWQEHGGSNPFTHPAWIEAWLTHLGGALEPLIITVRQGGALVGLAPLGISRFGPWRRLILLGSPMADYPDLLIHCDHPEIIGLLTKYLFDARWDWIDFVDISERSRNLNLLIDAFKKNGCSPIIQQGAICPGIRISEGWEEYWSRKKSKTRYTINKKSKRLAAECGPLSLQVLTTGEEIGRGLEEASKVHAARWARQHTRTMFSEKKGQAFFGEALSGLAREGMVRLYLLRAGDRLTAFSLSFVGGGAHYYYIPGFDQAFAKDSPGHLLLLEIVREAHELGLGLFDFMRGEEEYKYRWAETHDYTMRLLAAKPGPWAAAGFGIRRSFFSLRDWARTNSVARKIYFGLMNPLARLKKSRGGTQADN